MRTEPSRPGKTVYSLALAAMLFGIIAAFTAIPLTIAFPPGRGATFAQALQVLLSIKALVSPIPEVLRKVTPHLVAIALFWAQSALVARRLALCIRKRELVVPAALTAGWKLLLVIALLSWVVGTVVFLSPIFFYAVGARGAVWGMQIANTFFTGYLFLPALNLFGVTFFVVEILSAGREGWLPRRVESNLAAPEAAQAGERGDRSVSFRRLGAIGLLVGLALVVVPPVWSLFPTGIVYERLCNERAGEHLYKTVSAKSYVLIGEGAGGDAFHLHHALEDVTEHRAEFVEVVKDRANNHQANAFGMLLRNHNPPGDVFRVALGASGSRDCISRPTPMYGTKFTLEVGQCLRFTPIAAPTSRYRVEVINNEQARWYTPHIRTYGVRVVDGEEGSVLGEHVRFVRGGMLAFFVVGDKNLSCPSPYRFQPTQIHRKALLGGQ